MWELELKSERQNAEIRITDPTQYQSIVDAEWNIIYDKLHKIRDSGAKVVLFQASDWRSRHAVFCGS